MDLTVTVTGMRDLLQHNGRLADALNPYTRRLRKLTSKRQKTDDDLAEIMHVEARGSCWETDDGLLGVPNAAVWRCIYDAAKGFKRGEHIKRALLLDDITVPLLIGGESVDCDTFLLDGAHVDYRPVVVQRRKTMRARARVPAGWQSVHRFELLTDELDPGELVPILDRAGRLYGIGDWRPTYGRFSATIEAA